MSFARSEATQPRLLFEGEIFGPKRDGQLAVVHDPKLERKQGVGPTLGEVPVNNTLHSRGNLLIEFTSGTLEEMRVSLLLRSKPLPKDKDQVKWYAAALGGGDHDNPFVCTLRESGLYALSFTAHGLVILKPRVIAVGKDGKGYLDLRVTWQTGGAV